jgi:hypothetical protein
MNCPARFRIAWRSLTSDESGHGKYYLTFEQARDWLTFLAGKFTVEHWMEEYPLEERMERRSVRVWGLLENF